MFFSVVAPDDDLRREAALSRIDGPYADHQWLWRLFPADAGAPREFLFRRRDDGGGPRYYVVSKRAPVGPPAGWSVRTATYAPKVRPGTRLRFDLRANPVVTVREGDRQVRHDVVMHAKKRLMRDDDSARWNELDPRGRPMLADLVLSACRDWLATRGPQLGFAIALDTVSAEGYARHAEKGGRLKFSTVDLAGELTVDNPSRFVECLFAGIGHAKAFGCGLLLVRPTA